MCIIKKTLCTDFNIFHAKIDLISNSIAHELREVTSYNDHQQLSTGSLRGVINASLCVRHTICNHKDGQMRKLRLASLNYLPQFIYIWSSQNGSQTWGSSWKAALLSSAILPCQAYLLMYHRTGMEGNIFVKRRVTKYSYSKERTASGYLPTFQRKGLLTLQCLILHQDHMQWAKGLKEEKNKNSFSIFVDWHWFYNFQIG